MAIQMRRVYDPPTPGDGYRVLIDRVWPQGVSKEKARLDAWLKELAVSTELRRWFGHDPARWDEFRERYGRELRAPERRACLQELAERARAGPVTIVYGARDTEHNNAVVLATVLDEVLASSRARQ
jgi:uncharacterized protein YeaO (DUF488 family)